MTPKTAGVLAVTALAAMIGGGFIDLIAVGVATATGMAIASNQSARHRIR